MDVTTYNISSTALKTEKDITLERVKKASDHKLVCETTSRFHAEGSLGQWMYSVWGDLEII